MYYFSGREGADMTQVSYFVCLRVDFDDQPPEGGGSGGDDQGDKK